MRRKLWYNEVNTKKENETMQFSLIIPTYNETRHLKDSLPALSAFFETHFKDADYEVLFIDDGSRDESAAMIENFGHPAFKVLSYGQNRGKGYAVRYGMLHAKGDIRIFTDCDLAYGTDAIYEMYTRLLETGAGMSIASRRLHNEGYGDYTFMRKLMSVVYYTTLKIFTSLKVSDSQCGLKGFTAKAAEEIFSLCEADRFAFDIEVILFAQSLGTKIDEMPAKVLANDETTVSATEPFRMLREAMAIKKRVKRKMKEIKNT